jgi:hypothetical protein
MRVIPTKVGEYFGKIVLYTSLIIGSRNVKNGGQDLISEVETDWG